MLLPIFGRGATQFQCELGVCRTAHAEFQRRLEVIRFGAHIQHPRAPTLWTRFPATTITKAAIVSYMPRACLFEGAAGFEALSAVLPDRLQHPIAWRFR